MAYRIAPAFRTTLHLEQPKSPRDVPENLRHLARWVRFKQIDGDSRMETQCLFSDAESSHASAFPPHGYKAVAVIHWKEYIDELDRKERMDFLGASE